MGENDKYGKYFYDSISAHKKAVDEIVREKDERLAKLAASGENVFISRNDPSEKDGRELRAKGLTNVIDPRDLVYSDRIVQNSEIMDSRAKLTVDRIARNVNNSVGNKPVVKTSTKKKNDTLWDKLSKTGKEAVAVIVVACVSLTGYFAAKGIDDFSDKLEVNDYLEQYDEAYHDNKFVVNIGSLDANGDPYYDYDILGMGRDIAESDDPEASLYAIYSNTNYLKYDVVRDTFEAAKEVNSEAFGESKTFKEYATSLGCVDEDGNIDYGRYEEITEARLLAKKALAENSVSEVSVK